MTKIVEGPIKEVFDLLKEILIQNQLEEVALEVNPRTTSNQQLTIIVGRTGAKYSVVNGTSPSLANLVAEKAYSLETSRVVVFTLNSDGKAWFYNADSDAANASHRNPEERWGNIQHAIKDAVHSQEVEL